MIFIAWWWWVGQNIKSSFEILSVGIYSAHHGYDDGDTLTMIHTSIINYDDGDTLSRHCIGGSSRRPMGGRAGWQAYNPWWLWCSMVVEDEDCEDRNNGWWWLLTRMVDGDKDWRWWCCWLLFQPGHGKGWPGKAKLKTASKLFQYPVTFLFFFCFLESFCFSAGRCFLLRGVFPLMLSVCQRYIFSVQPQNVFHWRRHLSLIKSKLHSGQCVQPVHLLKYESESHPTQFNASNISEVMTSCVGM